MLSLTDGTLIAYDTRKCGSDFRLYFKDEDGDPSIDAADHMTLFDTSEIHIFLYDYNLSIEKFRTLVEMAKGMEHPPDSLDRTLHRAFRRVQKMLRKKMTRELTFDADTELLPKVFINRGWIPHVLICGATGAGKSYLCAKLLISQTINKDVIVFTKVPNDPAWRKLKKRESFRIFPLSHHTYEDASKFELPTEDQIPNCAIVVFDDNSSLTKNLRLRGHINHPYADLNLRRYMHDLNESMLETSRHNENVVCNIQHVLKNSWGNKRARNESGFLFLFPRSNKTVLDTELFDRFGMKQRERDRLIDIFSKDSMHVLLHTHFLNFLMSSRRVIML